MKIDLHVHCSERSGCAVSTEEEMIKAAIGYGLDGISFTDHHRLVSAARVEELRKKYYPFMIFGGIEITIHGEDFVVLGIDDPILEEKKWSYAGLHNFVREKNGFITLVHPYRYHNEINVDVFSQPVDAVEIHSMNIGKCDEQLIKECAGKLNCRTLSNSDAHHTSMVGIYYNVLQGKAGNNRELVEILKAGAFTNHGMADRICEYNKTVEKREAEIRLMLEQGRDKNYYCSTTGDWEGHFNRVAMGKSYCI